MKRSKIILIDKKVYGIWGIIKDFLDSVDYRSYEGWNETPEKYKVTITIEKHLPQKKT